MRESIVNDINDTGITEFLDVIDATKWTYIATSTDYEALNIYNKS